MQIHIMRTLNALPLLQSLIMLCDHFLWSKFEEEELFLSDGP